MLKQKETMRNKQQGFAVIEILLIVLAASLVIGVGWYVYTQRKVKFNSPYANNLLEKKVKQNPSPNPVSPTDKNKTIYKWSLTGNLFESERGFKMPLIDGWELTTTDGGDLGTFDNKILAERVGVAPKVTVSGGRDGANGLFIGLSKSSDYHRELRGTKTSFTTASGLTVNKYSYYQANDSTDPDEPTPLSKGSTEYIYVIVKGDQTFSALYTILPGMTDYSGTTVERALNTIEM
jgi:hypothetical protein